MPAKKIYSVRWEDDDGDQGYFVQLTSFQARVIRTYLKGFEEKKIIKDIRVEPIEGEWLLSEREFLSEFEARYLEE